MENYFVHETAHIADSAKIGDETKIWINVQVRENAKIGQACIISKDAYIDHDVRIGDRVKIQNGVSVYHGVTIEDEVFVGPYVAFTNDYFPRAQNPDWEVSPTLIKKGASLGANSTIICGHTVGEYAMVGAGSVVTKDVPPYALVAGNPAKKMGRVCRCGMRVRGNPCAKCGFLLPDE
jgi:acetyltransferase-like isoleucine patch superfamily enzyme